MLFSIIRIQAQDIIKRLSTNALCIWSTALLKNAKVMQFTLKPAPFIQAHPMNMNTTNAQFNDRKSRVQVIQRQAIKLL